MATDYNDILFNSLMGVAQIRGQEENQRLAQERTNIDRDAEARQKFFSDAQAKILQDQLERSKAKDAALRKLIPAPDAVPGTFDDRAYTESLALGVDPVHAALIQGRLSPEDAVQAYKVNQQLLPGANNILDHSVQLEQLAQARAALATQTALQVKAQFPNADQKFLTKLIEDPNTYRDPIRLILGATGSSNDSGNMLANKIQAAAAYQQAKSQAELAIISKNAMMLKQQGIDTDALITAYNGANERVAGFGKTLADMAAADISKDSPEYKATLSNMLGAGAAVNALSDMLFSQKLDPRMITNIPPEQKRDLWAIISGIYLGNNAPAGVDEDAAGLALAGGADPSTIGVGGSALPLTTPSPAPVAPSTGSFPTPSNGGGQPAPTPTLPLPGPAAPPPDSGDLGGKTLGPLAFNTPLSERPAMLPMLPPQVTPQVLYSIAKSNPEPPTREEVAQIFMMVNDNPAEALAQARIILLRMGNYPASFAYNAPDEKVFASLNALLQNLRN